MPILILHYHEIWLKGCNRNFFVSKLKAAAELALEGLGVDSIQYEDNRLLISLDRWDEQAVPEAVERLKKVGGIAYMAVAEETEPTMDAIVELGGRVMADVPFRTFRVRARRAVKTFPFRSGDIERTLGRHIEEQALAAARDVKVDLRHADATCYVEVTRNRALIYSEKIPGLGGLPKGTAGKAGLLAFGRL